MKKIGFIDLDTSHPRSFIKRINAMDDFQVAGVFDRGRIKGKAETDAFCKEFAVKEYASAKALAEECDGVMILSADWATHFEDMKAVMQAGKACYCDKPLFGKMEEIDSFIEMCGKTGTPVFGGSGWRWNTITQNKAKEIAGAKISDALLCVPSDRFYYGIHIVEFALGLFGPGIEWVKSEKFEGNPTVVSLHHSRGMTLRLLLETGFSLSRFNVFSVDGKEHSVAFDGDDIHNGICNNFAKLIETGISPVTPDELVESVRIMFAIEESLRTGKRVSPDDISHLKEMPSNDFMENYKKSI